MVTLHREAANVQEPGRACCEAALLCCGGTQSYFFQVQKSLNSVKSLTKTAIFQKSAKNASLQRTPLSLCLEKSTVV